MHSRVTSIRRIQESNELRPAVRFVTQRWSTTFDCAVICGSGMSQWMSEGEIVDQILYAELEGFPQTSVKGHGNALLHLRLADKNILVFSGRFHLYEGWDCRELIKPVILCSELGVQNLICTNAAGGMNSSFDVGDVMLATGLLNLSGRSLHIDDDQSPYTIIDEKWLERVQQGLIAHPWLKSGVYCSVSGPSYETKAEIGMFSRFADAIGMSTVHEALCARLVGMNLLACSVISNTLCIPHEHALQHEEVLIATQAAAGRIARVIEVCSETVKSEHAR